MSKFCQLYLHLCLFLFLLFSTTWNTSKSDKRDWKEDDKKRKKRPYTLDLSKPQKSEEHPSPSEKPKPLKSTKKAPSPSKELLKLTEKPKRSKSRTRSPMQNHRKAQQMKKSPPVLLRSPAFSDEMSQDQKEKGATSDESSGGRRRLQTQGQVSPRKGKKISTLRRKSLSRSPTSSRTRRRSGSNEDKPSSLPSTLPRRRSMQPRDADDTPSTHSSKSRLSPHR